MRKCSPLSLLSLAALGLAACATPDGGQQAAAPGQPVSIAFALTAKGQPVRCGAAPVRLGSGHTAAGLHDARFYVQGVSLIDTAGTRVPVTLARNDWQVADVALLDFENGTGGCAGGTPATNEAVTGTVLPGSHEYVGLEFTVGVPVQGRLADGKTVSLNHSSTETAPAPLDIAAMGWSWQAGRKFMKVEVDPVGGVAKADGGKATTWHVHLGSTGCSGNPADGETVTCTRPNRATVTIPHFDARKQVVALDLAALLAGSTIARDKGGTVGCMSGVTDPECQAVFGRLGLAFNGKAPASVAKKAVSTVPAFTVVAKP